MKTLGTQPVVDKSTVYAYGLRFFSFSSTLACVPCPTGLNTFESFNQVQSFPAIVRTDIVQVSLIVQGRVTTEL